ncbi:MAG: helix-turn-helix domain-containing protein [Eubacteriales bacterium]|jgi:transcriptional regulator with XRE-family HTH domain
MMAESEKKSKSMFRQAREEMNLTREKASEMLEFITPERLEKIESGKSPAHPEEVLMMSKKYKKPDLCNYYCSHECPIGQQYVPEIRMKNLSEIVLQMLASLNSLDDEKKRLIEITADGKIEKKEVRDFVQIQKQLEKISVTVEALQLWAEKMLASGSIDLEEYNSCIREADAD